MQKYSPPDLPLLDFTALLFGKIDLHEVYLLGAQHLLPTTHSLFRKLFKMGLKKENCALIGKCYSTEYTVYLKMIEEGIDISPSSMEFLPHKAFDEVYKSSIYSFLKRKIETVDFSKIKKILFLDDGGELISVASTLFSDHLEKCVGIEQTSAGYEKLKNLLKLFPIINVARSHAKLVYESPLIAATACEELLNRLNSIYQLPRTVLIIGNGAIGSHVSAKLSTEFKVFNYDLDPTKNLCGQVTLDELLPNMDLIIGCTGKRVLDQSHFKILKKNVVLASCSSSDREFDSVFLRSHTKGLQSCHDDLHVLDIFLLNCGFPINLSGDTPKVDPIEFQLTRSLLLSGILQAASSNSSAKEITDLDSGIQSSIINQYRLIYEEGKQYVFG